MFWKWFQLYCYGVDSIKNMFIIIVIVNILGVNGRAFKVCPW